MLTSRVFPTLALTTVLALLLNSGYLAARAEHRLPIELERSNFRLLGITTGNAQDESNSN